MLPADQRQKASWRTWQDHVSATWLRFSSVPHGNRILLKVLQDEMGPILPRVHFRWACLSLGWMGLGCGMARLGVDMGFVYDNLGWWVPAFLPGDSGNLQQSSGKNHEICVYPLHNKQRGQCMARAWAQSTGPMSAVGLWAASPLHPRQGTRVGTWKQRSLPR